MARTPTRLHGPALLTNAAATKYTVPAATITLVRWIHISNPGAALSITISIGTDAAATRIFDDYPFPADTAQSFSCYYAMTAAEIIQALASETNQATLTIGGDEIT